MNIRLSLIGILACVALGACDDGETTDPAAELSSDSGNTTPATDADTTSADTSTSATTEDETEEEGSDDAETVADSDTESEDTLTSSESDTSTDSSTSTDSETDTSSDTATDSSSSTSSSSSTFTGIVSGGILATSIKVFTATTSSTATEVYSYQFDTVHLDGQYVRSDQWDGGDEDGSVQCGDGYYVHSIKFWTTTYGLNDSITKIQLTCRDPDGVASDVTKYTGKEQGDSHTANCDEFSSTDNYWISGLTGLEDAYVKDFKIKCAKPSGTDTDTFELSDGTYPSSSYQGGRSKGSGDGTSKMLCNNGVDPANRVLTGFKWYRVCDGNECAYTHLQPYCTTVSMHEE